MHAGGGQVALLARVDDHHRPPRPGQGEASAQAGGPAADHDDVVLLRCLVHASTVGGPAESAKGPCRNGKRRHVRGFHFTQLPPDAAQTYRLRGIDGERTIRFAYVVPNG